MPSTDDTKRREWLRALRRFKYGIKVRAKLGTLQHICDKVGAERKTTRQWDAPNWEHDKWLTLLYTSIRDTEFPPTLLEGFVKSAEINWFTPYQIKVSKVLEAVNTICRKFSRPLRNKFGVKI